MKAQIGNRIEFKGHYGKIGGEVVRKKEVYIVKDELVGNGRKKCF